ncbi:Fc.00g026780.m01.CDS01 [Cosmosporella sp. VM-42]
MSCTFNRIGPESRQYPLNRPEGWKVKYPRWTLKLPANINEVVIAYIGVQPPRTVPCEKGVYMNLHQHSVEESQRRAASVLEAWVTDDSATDAPNLWEKFYVETGYDVPDTEVWVLYWINRFSAESALSKLDLQHISPSSSSDTASMVGIWRESFTIPRERFETIYSGNDYQPGIASLEDSLQVSHEFTGYWGAARDRIPASSHSNFLPQHPAPIPDFAKHTKNRALRGYNRDVLLHIRSGQYWERCSREEREAYESALEPLLRKGMAYLEDNAAETGDFGLRFMRNIIPNRRLRGETMNRYTNFSTKGAEEFNTASRSVKPGLIAAGIVSAWTWAATLLQSSTVAYIYGVAGPFWVKKDPLAMKNDFILMLDQYAAGATVQILVFSLLACKTKINAPGCHTFLEIIRIRYGRFAHGVFGFFALLTNVLVGSQLLLGGSAVLTALTGMNVYAAIFLIPTSVVAYVLMGGLRATFLCDYSHTLILMVIILYFMFQVYCENELIGSPSAMYYMLKNAAIKRPVSGNQDGSYMTLKSNSALVFGVIQLCAGCGVVFLDQAYWQRAIASKPSTAVRAYILGGLAWFAIPFGFATTLGLAAVALTDHPSFPTYPRAPTAEEISSGLASAFATSALLGKSGAAALLITLFMAVTSCASAELIAVSSILTFDIYKTYVNPTATPKQIIFWAHANVAIFGLTMAVFAAIWNVIGIDLGWLYLVMGLLIGGAVFPTAFAVTWKGQSRAGAIAGSLSGLAAGVTAWLLVARIHYGELTLSSTGANYPTLAGNLAAMLTSLVVSVTVSLAKPQNFDWEKTRSMNLVPNAEENNPPAKLGVGLGGDSGGRRSIELVEGYELPNETSSPSTESTYGKNLENPRTTIQGSKLETIRGQGEMQQVQEGIIQDDHSHLQSALKLAYLSCIILPLIMDVIIPIPMFLSHYIFSKAFFTAWVVIGFVWVFASTAISVFLPIWETRSFFKQLFRAFVSDARGGRRP